MILSSFCLQWEEWMEVNLGAYVYLIVKVSFEDKTFFLQGITFAYLCGSIFGPFILSHWIRVFLPLPISRYVLLQL